MRCVGCGREGEEVERKRGQEARTSETISALARASLLCIDWDAGLFQIRWTWPQQRFSEQCILAICPEAPPAGGDPGEVSVYYRLPIDRASWEAGGGSRQIHVSPEWRDGCVAVWARLVKRFTLIPTWRGALATLTLAFIPLYFANSLITSIIGSALVGFGFSGVITTMDLIGAKIMDEDTQKHNLRREGIISNAMGFMNRLNGLFTSFAFFMVFRLFGFESGANPGPEPQNAARFLLTVFPVILMIISFGFSFLLHFDRTNAPEVSAETV